MARPSEPLLAWLRDLIQKRGLNTAAVAERAKLPRPRVRQLLAGTEPMLVDELMKLSEALEISPTDMGLPGGAEFAEDAVAEGVDVVPEPPTDDTTVTIDPYGNHPEQMFRTAFALGCDFFFLVEADLLADSGVPGHVLKQYEGRDLPVKLDAAYHSYNDPRYSPLGIRLTLSFDQLYECTFPWTCVRQFVMFPAAPDALPEEPPEPDSDEDEAPRSVPHLRLVT
jgi:transcriptional regulator with XRE-family HTH domain